MSQCSPFFGSVSLPQKESHLSVFFLGVSRTWAYEKSGVWRWLNFFSAAWGLKKQWIISSHKEIRIMMNNNSYIPLPETSIAPQKWCERETDPFFSFESQPLKAMPKLEPKGRFIWVPGISFRKWKQPGCLGCIGVYTTQLQYGLFPKTHRNPGIPH